MLDKLIPKGGKGRKLLRDWYNDRHIPKKLSRNFIAIDEYQNELLLHSLCNHTFGAQKSIDSAEVRHEVDILASRFRNHRSRIIPWLDSVRPLKGLRILEIGCGNGTSTVALAEQGALVTAIDIEEGLLKDAEERCRIYGLEASFHLMNATAAATSFAGEQFDMILFFAVLEHMTYAERIKAIHDTYEMLAPGGLWCVIGTPNRLYFFDSHTAMLPFYFWLPDELAIKYASFSTRKEFGNRFDPEREPTDDEKLEFARWGRGMSYHELELAIGPLTTLRVVSSLSGYLKKRDIMYRLGSRYLMNGSYQAFFKRLYPTVHASFFDPFLDIIIQK
jgi:2-polyprenyl-3-methyl-5-hydroxy-6-metoxy-1,4-benzoquinol methylase